MMSKGEYEGVVLIVGLLGIKHPTIAIIQPLLDEYRYDGIYDGTDPEGEARGLREALQLIKEASGVMPNVQAHLERLDRRSTRRAPQVPATVNAPMEPGENAEPGEQITEGAETNPPTEVDDQWQ